MVKQLPTYILIFMFIVLIFSCGRSRHRDRNNNARIEKITTNHNAQRQSNSTQGKSIVKMRQEYGVYHIPCKINGMEMEFILDTGASDITMSLTEALFLYKQEKLRDDDFVGTQKYQIADGSIHEGTIVMLRSVVIGNRTLTNVQASIVDNMEAPLLLGQSALAKFGKISIDYNRNEVIFE